MYIYSLYLFYAAVHAQYMHSKKPIIITIAHPLLYVILYDVYSRYNYLFISTFVITTTPTRSFFHFNGPGESRRINILLFINYYRYIYFVLYMHARLSGNFYNKITEREKQRETRLIRDH